MPKSYVLQQAFGPCKGWYWGPGNDEIAGDHYVSDYHAAYPYASLESANIYLELHYERYGASNGVFLVREKPIGL